MCAGAGHDSLSKQVCRAHPFVSHAAVTQEGVSACSGQVSGLKGLVIKTTVYAGGEHLGVSC